MTIVLALAAIAFSAVPILLLCLGDPKRRRAAGESGGSPDRHRAMLVTAGCVPGIAVALLGDSAAFMLWLGGIALLGWCAAASFAPRRNQQRS